MALPPRSAPRARAHPQYPCRRAGRGRCLKAPVRYPWGRRRPLVKGSPDGTIEVLRRDAALAVPSGASEVQRLFSCELPQKRTLVAQRRPGRCAQDGSSGGSVRVRSNRSNRRLRPTSWATRTPSAGRLSTPSKRPDINGQRQSSREPVSELWAQYGHSRDPLKVKPQVRPYKADELACRPGSVPPAPRGAVGGDHPSTTTVAGRLQRSTRALGRAALERARAPRPEARDFLTLLQVGFTKPFRSPGTLVVSCTTVSPLPRRPEPTWRSVFCGTFPRVAPGGCYPPPCPVEPGPSSGTLAGPRGRPASPSAGTG